MVNAQFPLQSIAYSIRDVNTGTPRRLLVLTYEFPPTGGGGVQRIAKFCRDLQRHGWEPTVVTAEHVQGRPYDASLCTDVEGIPVVRLAHHNLIHAIAAPLAVLKRALSSRGSSDVVWGSVASNTQSTRTPMSTRVARWLSVPDEAARWARSAALHVQTMDTRFDAVLASGPPHSTLVAGRTCAERRGIPLVVDMRDSWAHNPHFYFATPVHRWLIERQQRRVCGSAALVTAVSPRIADEARAFGARSAEVIPNGYDASEMPPLMGRPEAPLTLAFMGRFYGLTDPTPLLDALAHLVGVIGGRGVHLEIVGTGDPAVEAAVRSRGLQDVVTFHGYLPHEEALRVVAGCDVGVVVIADEPGAESVYTGKLFEYLGMGIATLVIGPVSGAAAELVLLSGAGRVVGYRDSEAIALVLADLADMKAAGSVLASPVATLISSFERSQQAARLARLLDDVISEEQ